MLPNTVGEICNALVLSILNDVLHIAVADPETSERGAKEHEI